MKKKFNLKYISIILGAIVGLLLGILIGETNALDDVSGITTLIIFLIGVYLSFFLQVIIHELGHLIFGLITGYKFLSYRIGNLMLIKKNNKLKIKKLSLMGTGGQCLMAPPDYNNGVPYLLYNLGGVIFNIVFSIIFLVLYLSIDIFLIKTFSLIMVFIGLFTVFTNGIPFSSDINNDGYNVLLMLRNKETIYDFWLQMKINEQLLNGVRLKDMKDKWFKGSGNDNAISNTIKVLECNKLIDEKKYLEAYKKIDELLNSDLKLINIHCIQLTLYGIYLELVLDLEEKYIKMYHDDKMKRYIMSMKNSIDVLCVNYAYALLKENNLNKGEEIKNIFNKVILDYPYESDIISIKQLMEYAESKKDSVL